MKLKSIAALTLLTGWSHGTIVTAANVTDGGAATLPIRDNTGALLQTGVVAIGSYPDNPVFIEKVLRFQPD